eukprot:2099790-Rhodomonas_salina.1
MSVCSARTAERCWWMLSNVFSYLAVTRRNVLSLTARTHSSRTSLSSPRLLSPRFSSEERRARAREEASVALREEAREASSRRGARDSWRRATASAAFHAEKTARLCTIIRRLVAAHARSVPHIVHCASSIPALSTWKRVGQ